MSSKEKAGKGAPVAARLGIWAFLATELLLFGALFTAYTQFRAQYPDLFYQQHLHLNRLLGALNTVLLLTSSLSTAVGIAAIRRGRAGLMKLCIVLTLMCAAGFLGIKYIEWTDDFSHGFFPSTNLFWSCYFVMTGLHGLHVLAGMLVMVYLLVQAKRGFFTAEYHTPVEITGLYWHFVDLVWIYLFPLLYLVG